MTLNLRARISPAVAAIPPSGIRRFFDLAAEMEGVISLGVGEPDFVTPWRIREACVDALERGFTCYTANRGRADLLNAISLYLARFGVDYNPASELIVTIGASEAIDLALRTIVCSGEEVLVPEPCYVSYKPSITLAGGVPVGVPTHASDGFRLSVAELERRVTPHTKALLLCNPNNPTGTAMSREDLAQITRFVEEHDLLVIADEIYAELTYGKPHVCFASLPGMQERTILISGMSKAFAMTGWRLGYVAAHPDLCSAMLKVHQYTIMCAPHMAQIAALEALTSGEADVRRMMETYDGRRRLIVSGLRQAGLECHEPEGAFYVFPSIQVTGLTSETFAQELLSEEKVAVVPGAVFGEGGEGHIRCSYATSTESIAEAVERIARFVSKRIARR